MKETKSLPSEGFYSNSGRQSKQVYKSEMEWACHPRCSPCPFPPLPPTVALGWQWEMFSLSLTLSVPYQLQKH